MKRPLSITRATAALISARSGRSGVAVSKSGTATTVDSAPPLPELSSSRADDTATRVRTVGRLCAALARRRRACAELAGGRPPERNLGIAFDHFAARVDNPTKHRAH